MRRHSTLSITVTLSFCLLAAPLLPHAGAAPLAAEDATAAPPASSEAALPTDQRLLQKVTVHASLQKLSDLLTWLSKATGVTLMARMEVADEKVTVWAEDRPLIDLMRDLRHLHGCFWSRSKRGNEYIYSLWQDAQSRQREEAELQRWALEKQREFERRIRGRVQALSASDEELKHLGREDPYLVVQMKHPVVRNGYRLFACLSPDQQAQLTQVRTPGRLSSFGFMLQVFPLDHKPSDPYFNPKEWRDYFEPRGDVITLRWGEMTPSQQAAVRAIIQGAAVRRREEAARERLKDLDGPNQAKSFEWQAQSTAAANPESATATFFRWGDPSAQGLSLRVDFQSGGRGWCIYSNIGLPGNQFYDEMLRKGGNIPGSSPEADALLSEARKPENRPPPPPPPVFSAARDPVLDAPLSFTWPLPLREAVGKNAYRLNHHEMMAALNREIRRPLVLDSLPRWLEQERSLGPLFHWQNRPLRELLERFFPGCKGHTRGGAIFIVRPDRVQERLNQVPRAVLQFLDEMKGPFSLDDMALLARSLSPWEIVKLHEYLPNGAIDQTLVAQELLKLYSELSPEQRALLPKGLPFSALTPPQQALFLQFAQRQQPFVEPWRFQHGGLQLSTGPSPVKDDGRGGPTRTVTRAAFAVRFGEGEAATYPIDLFPSTGRVGWNAPVTRFVGKPFPGFRRNNKIRSAAADDDPVWQPALNDPRLKNRTAIVIVARPFAEPYVATRPPGSSAALADTLAGRLRDIRISIAHVTVGAKETAAKPTHTGTPAPWIALWEPGEINGEPFDAAGAEERVPQSPTVFLVGADGIVRGVFQGMQAWDIAAIERAARRLVSYQSDSDRLSRRSQPGWNRGR